MPYSSISELPKGIKGYPKRAQEIWMSAFNSAHASGKYSEESVFKIAWAAVKKKFNIHKEKG